MLSPYVDALMALPPSEVGTALLALPEDQWFERKSARVAAKDFAVALVAMANAEGGSVVVGLHDGRVEGVRSDGPKLNDLRQAPLDHTTPAVRTRFHEVACIDEHGKPAVVLLARVEPGDVVHEMRNGECYLRVGDESRRLSFTQRQELHYDRGSAPYDGTAAPDTAVEDLDSDLVAGYVDSTGASRPPVDVLAARSLITRAGLPTVAAYLLFAANPQDRMPHSVVRVLRYTSAERGTGARLTLDAESDLRVGGSLSQQIHEAAEVIERWVPRHRALTRAGTFEAVPIVPRDAWLEGVVNAVIHRSYSAAGDHIRVEIFPDRIEIESPGRFPGLVDPSQPLNISRYARNPRIARVCADLRIAQELGEGITRMFAEMRSRGLADPGYRQTSGSVRLTLSSLPALDPAVARRLPRGAPRLMDVLREAASPLGTGEIVTRTGLSRPTAMKYLRSLQDEGLVTWDGKSTRDPRAAWRLA